VSRILSPSETRRELERLQHQPDGRLGQNFLVDGNIVRKSLRSAAIQPGETVVEIGPGLGTLTSALLDAGAIVYAIEFDRVLYQYLNDILAPAFPDRLHLSQGDAVKVPLAGIPASYDGRYKIVANLPYAISTPWMAAVLTGPLPQRMVLMLQTETASRFIAPHGSKNFSAISILLQSAFLPTESSRVSPNCFHPRPEVGSTLIQMDLRSEPLRLAPESMDMIRGLFRKRRKQIGSLLKPIPPGIAAPFLAAIESAGLSARSRPEAIPLALWHQLDQLVRNENPNSTGDPFSSG
jgi:16S rRNA (adenine1518-N6/adenine1519-N6)-dimethyltransferase